MIEDDAPLLDFDVKVVFADGIARADFVAGNVRLLMFRYAYQGLVRVRVPVLEIIRPAATWEPTLAGIIDRYGARAN